MEATVSKFRENTGSVTGNLRSMPIGENNREFIHLVDAANIRGLITQIHKATSGINAGFKFETVSCINENGEPGIWVWRTA